MNKLDPKDKKKGSTFSGVLRVDGNDLKAPSNRLCPQAIFPVFVLFCFFFLLLPCDLSHSCLNIPVVSQQDHRAIKERLGIWRKCQDTGDNS